MQILRPYMLWQYPVIEQWLEAKAQDGWRLERVGGWMFQFRESESREVRFRFFFEQPRLGHLLETKLELQQLHAEEIRTGLFTPTVMRMTPAVAEIRKHCLARRREHLSFFGMYALVFVIFALVALVVWLCSDTLFSGEAVCMVCLVIMSLMGVIQYAPAFFMELNKK